MSHEKDIFFDRHDIDTWAAARIHHSLLLQIQNSPLWQAEPIPDIPFNEEQMISFTKGYAPDWECRYAPYYLGGWYYIARAGFWQKKFKYEKGDDGYYHIKEHYTTEMAKGTNLLKQVIGEGYFCPPLHDERLSEILSTVPMEL